MNNVRQLICPNGHSFEAAEPISRGDAVGCPVCAAPVEWDAGSQGPASKGLWALMRRGEVNESSAPKQQSIPGLAAASTATIKESATRTDSAADTIPSNPQVSRPRGLWGLMPVDSAPPTTEPRTDEREPDLREDDEQDAWEVDDPDANDALPTPVSTVTPVSPATPPTTRGKINAALGLGIASVLLTTLNLSSWFWTKFPAPMVGVIALILGHQLWSDRKRTAERQKMTVVAAATILCGVVGLLAGPIALNSIGQQWRSSSMRHGAKANLESIGVGMTAFHDEHSHYPAGGTFARSEEGAEIPLHGWMTALLPHIGRSDLANQIDLRRSYDDPVNGPAMSQPVATYLVPGVTHRPTNLGMASTHFSGVGGQRNDPIGLVNLGVFERNTTVTRADITDGLSQTFVVGEIAAPYPAWGDPENWRQIESGLNRHSFGFGNSNGTGAHFLMADGSVRFFPNHTALRILEQLSSRDGDDSIAVPLQ